MARETSKVTFLGLGPGDLQEIVLDVMYVAGGFARGPDGLCAFCHGDPCDEDSPKDSLIAKYFATAHSPSSCPVCEGMAS
jgi:hypothetical protein